MINKGMTLVRLLLGLALLVFCMDGLAETANESEWNANGSGGWNDPNRWTNHLVPTNGMGVRISGTTAIATDDDVGILMRKFAYIVLPGGSSTLIVSNETKAARIRTIIYGDGSVVKRGPGRLAFDKPAGMAGDATSFQDTLKGIVIEDGVAELTAPTLLAVEYNIHCPVTVNAPGILSVYSAKGTVFKKPLFGDGVISNATATSYTEGGAYIYFQGGTRERPGVFAGTGVGYNRIFVSAHQRFTNGNWSKTLYEPIVNASTMPSIGMSAMSSYVVFRNNGEYESLTEDGSIQTGGFWINNSTRYFKLDAGPVGGQTFNATYNVTHDTGRPGRAYLFELTGTNAAPASLAKDYNWSFSGSIGRLKKTGTGTWNLVGVHNTRGVTAVAQGTLNYDTLAEAGSNCSLGTAQRPQAEYYGELDDTKDVDYTCLIGDGVTDYGSQQLAKLNYNGSTARTIANRPVAIDKAGIFSADTSVDWTGFRPLDAEPTTLVLAGSADSIAHSVCNGDGILSVVKEGTGKWSVKGDFDFSGGAYAREGTLELDTATKYAYYKLTLMDNCYDWSKQGDGSIVWLSQIALIDADNENAAIDLKYNTAADGKPTALEPGQAAFGRTGFNYLAGNSVSYGFTNLFNSAKTVCAGSFEGRPYLDKPNTWVSFVMRPNPGFKPIKKYDIRHWACQTSGYVQMWSREPLSWKMEGSVDGVTWKELHSVITNDSPVVKGSYNWETTDSNTYDGFEIASEDTSLVRPQSLAKIGAASGATLKVTGNTLPANGLVYDAARGAGSLDGFAFAANGTLDIRTANPKADISFRHAFSNCTGVGNLAGWTLKINGAVSSRKVHVAADGTITVPVPGLVVSFD